MTSDPNGSAHRDEHASRDPGVPADGRPDPVGRARPRPPRAKGSPCRHRAASVWLSTPQAAAGHGEAPSQRWLADALACLVKTYALHNDRMLVANTMPVAPELEMLHDVACSIPGLAKAVQTWLFLPDEHAHVPGSNNGGSAGPGSAAGPPSRPPWPPVGEAFTQPTPIASGLDVDFAVVGFAAQQASLVAAFPWSALLSAHAALAVITPHRHHHDALSGLVDALRATSLSYHDRIAVVSMAPAHCKGSRMSFQLIAEIAVFVMPGLGMPQSREGQAHR
jgi:hypothetical protein